MGVLDYGEGSGLEMCETEAEKKKMIEVQEATIMMILATCGTIYDHFYFIYIFLIIITITCFIMAILIAIVIRYLYQIL